MRNEYLVDTKFKPCPFCGKRSSLLIDRDDEIGAFFVWCAPSDYGCGTTGPAGLDKADALAKWNTRVIEINRRIWKH